MGRAHNDMVEGAMMTCYNEPGKFDCNLYKKARENAPALLAAQGEAMSSDGESDGGDDSQNDDM